MTESPPANQNGTPFQPPIDWNAKVRDRIRTFNTMIDRLEAVPASEAPPWRPSHLSLLNALIPPFIRWQVEQERLGVEMGDRMEAMVETLSVLYANELRLPSEPFWDRVERLIALASAVMTKAAFRIHQREIEVAAEREKAAEAAKGMPRPTTPDTGHA